MSAEKNTWNLTDSPRKKCAVNNLLSFIVFINYLQRGSFPVKRLFKDRKGKKSGFFSGRFTSGERIPPWDRSTGGNSCGPGAHPWGNRKEIGFHRVEMNFHRVSTGGNEELREIRSSYGFRDGFSSVFPRNVAPPQRYQVRNHSRPQNVHIPLVKPTLNEFPCKYSAPHPKNRCFPYRRECFHVANRRHSKPVSGRTKTKPESNRLYRSFSDKHRYVLYKAPVGIHNYTYYARISSESIGASFPRPPFAITPSCPRQWFN